MGKVFLVGAGPFEAGLITVKGLEKIQTCDVLIYDRLVSEELVNRTKRECTKIFVGKEKGFHSKSQDEINELLVKYALEFDVVVRLKGGDPFVFGRGGEEVETLIGNQIPFEVIPGISSCISVPELCGIPVTHRGISKSFCVITGHEGQGKINMDELKRAASLEGTLVILMGLSNLENIVEILLKNGKNEATGAAVISKGSTPQEKIIRGRLDQIYMLAGHLASPAIVVVGDVAGLELKDAKKKVAIGAVGSRSLIEKLRLEAEKESMNVYPVQEFQVVENEKNLEEVSKGWIESKDWILFTGSNSVRVFFEYLKKRRVDHRCFRKIRFAVVGKGTATTLLEYGFVADLIPKTWNLNHLQKELSGQIQEGESIILVTGEDGNDNFQNENAKDVGLLQAFRLESGWKGNISTTDALEYLIFTSEKCFLGFWEMASEEEKDAARNKIWACIGSGLYNKLKERFTNGWFDENRVGEERRKGMEPEILFDKDVVSLIRKIKAHAEGKG